MDVKHLDVLSIDVSGVLKSPPIIVLLFIPPFMLIFIYLDVPVLDTYVYECYFFFLYWSLYHYIMSFFVLYYRFCFKVYFVCYVNCYPNFLFISTGMEYLISSPHFQWVGLSLVLKWVSWAVNGWVFFILSK